MSSKKGKSGKSKHSSKNSDSTMGDYPPPDNLELNLDQSLDNLENSHFPELALLLKSIPGFDDNSEFEAIRKDPLAMLNTPSVTVDKVMKLIQIDLASGKLACIQSEYLRLCIGNYCLGRAELGFPSELIFCRYGIAFPVRPVNIFFRQKVNVGIPITDIMSIKIYNGNKLCVVGISTGTAHAAWLRTKIGMLHDPEVIELRKAENLPAPFYGPLLGGKDHKWIIMLVNTLTEIDCSKLTTLFLHPNGKDFICDFKMMESNEAHEFIRNSNIFEAK